MSVPAIPDGITDIHLRFVEGEVDLAGSLAFPGATPLHPDLYDLAIYLAKRCLEEQKEELTIVCRGRVVRAQRDDTAIDGLWYRLRIGLGECRGLNYVPSPLPEWVCSELLSDRHCRGGLILIVGGPGCGKTTTASAMVVSRLERFGGIAFTIEDPPEYLLNGRHGLGLCTQRHVTLSPDGLPDWAFTIRRILRSQPVGGNLMLFIGELRDRGAAQMAVRAAANGFLVVTTAFATDLVSGIASLCSLLDDERLHGQFATLLHAVVYQHIGPSRRLSVDMLTSRANSEVSQWIKAGKFSLLQDALVMQRNRRVRGEGVG